MSIYIAIMIAGFGGGMVRGLVGFLKNQYSYKTSTFNLSYFFVMMFLSGIVGLLVAFAIKNSFISFEGVSYISPAIAFILPKNKGKQKTRPTRACLSDFRSSGTWITR